MSSIDFRQLVDQHSRLVLKAAFGVLGDSAGAEDVHQEVFMAIWQKWYTYNGNINWPAYLYRTAVNKAIDHSKKIRRDRNAVENFKPGEEYEKPESKMIASETQNKLRALIAKLPQRQAEVFTMSRIHGLKYEKIGKVLGCSPETARVHMHRALKKLAKEFAGVL